MLKKLSKYLPYLIIITIAVCIRLLYALIHPKIILTPDSFGYYLGGIDMVNSPTRIDILVNFYRTPLYAIVINLIMKIQGLFGAEFGSINFDMGSNGIMFFQHALGVLTTLLIYPISRKINLSPKTAFIVALLYASNLLVIPWERAMLTEGMAISWTIIFFLFSLKLWQNPTKSKFILFGLLSIIGILLRPVFLTLPLFYLFFIIIVNRKKEIILSAILAGLMCLLIPVGYIFINSSYHGYNEFQVTGTFNVLGRIMKNNFTADTAKSAPFFTQKMSDYKSNNGNPQPYDFINFADQGTFGSPARLSELRTFTNQILIRNLPGYIVSAFRDIPQALVDVDPVIEIKSNGNDILIWFLLTIQKIHGLMILLYLLTIPFQLVFLITLFKNDKKQNVIIGIFQTLILWQIFITVFYGYGEFGRLLSVVAPVMEIVVFYWLQYFITEQFQKHLKRQSINSL